MQRYDLPFHLDECSALELQGHFDRLKAEQQKLEREKASYGFWNENAKTRELDREIQHVGQLAMYVYHELHKRTELDYDV